MAWKVEPIQNSFVTLYHIKMKALFKILVCVTTAVYCSIALSTASCKPQLAIERTSHDTVWKERTVVYHDTVYKTTPLAVKTTVYVPCPEQMKKTFKPGLNQNGNAKQSTRLKGDSLVIECLCDTAFIKARLKDTYEKEYRSSHTDEKEKVPVRYVPGIVSFFAWSGGLFWLLLAIFLFKKFYLKK